MEQNQGQLNHQINDLFLSSLCLFGISMTAKASVIAHSIYLFTLYSVYTVCDSSH